MHSLRRLLATAATTTVAGGASRPAAAAAQKANAWRAAGCAVAAVGRSRGFAAPAASATLSGTAKSKLEKAKRQARKKTVAQLIKVRSGPVFHVDEAIRVVKALGCTGAFDATVNIQVQLGIDPRKTDMTVRGVASLPHGSGKKVVVAVFAKGEKAAEARRAGAAIVGDVDLVERIAKGDVSFNKTIATPDMMPLVGRVARVLGPRGLMPNPKLGTVTLNVADAVAAAMRGQAQFRSEKRGIVATGVGKASFSEGALRDNVKALLQTLYAQRPEGFKGAFIRQAFLSSTHAPAIPLDLAVVDPASPRFMGAWDGAAAHVVAPEHITVVAAGQQQQASA